MKEIVENYVEIKYPLITLLIQKQGAYIFSLMEFPDFPEFLTFFQTHLNNK